MVTAVALNTIIANLQLGFVLQLYLYGDKAFMNASHIISAHHTVPVHPLEAQDNQIAAAPRTVGVEHFFGKLKKNYAFLDFSRNLKSGMQAVSTYWRMGTVLCNFHTCLRGGSATAYFGVPPPSPAQMTGVAAPP
jgi:hypothetical protein